MPFKSNQLGFVNCYKMSRYFIILLIQTSLMLQAFEPNNKMYIFFCVVSLFAVCNAQEPRISEEVIDECNSRNGYYKIEGSCDGYVECLDYQPFRMLCPDGLNYNPKAKWPAYPCGYPSDVPCDNHDTAQPAKSTTDCPRQYGFFPSPKATANDCGHYRMCSQGHAYDMFCPFGLAFDTVSARCEWADLVPGCNPEEYIGFKCPAPEYDLKGNPLISNFKYEGDCYMFYSCQSRHARLLSCDPGFAFDASVGRCAEADLVNCVPSSNDNDADDDDKNE